jgi:hypothetical protein
MKVELQQAIDALRQQEHKPPVGVSSLDTCDEDKGKCGDARSILRMNMTDLDWFRPSRGVTTLRLASMYYAVKCDALIDCGWLLL